MFLPNLRYYWHFSSSTNIHLLYRDDGLNASILSELKIVCIIKASNILSSMLQGIYIIEIIMYPLHQIINVALLSGLAYCPVRYEYSLYGRLQKIIKRTDVFSRGAREGGKEVGTVGMIGWSLNGWRCSPVERREVECKREGGR